MIPVLLLGLNDETVEFCYSNFKTQNNYCFVLRFSKHGVTPVSQVFLYNNMAHCVIMCFIAVSYNGRSSDRKTAYFEGGHETQPMQ